MNEIFNKIKYFKEIYKPMSSNHNLFFEYFTLNYHKPKKIVEIGAGAAGWALTINELLNYDQEFVLFEDFRQTDYNGFEWWPNNKKDLKDYIVQKNKNFKYSLQDKYIKTDNADVLRFDAWGTSLKEFEDIISHLSDNAIILFDDFSVNKDLDLIILVLELYKKQLIYPIWASDTVSCWTKSEKYSKEIIFYLNNNKDELMKITNSYVNYKKFSTVLNLYFELIQIRPTY